MQASAPVPDTTAKVTEAVAELESGQDRSTIIVIVTPKKVFYISRNARSRARNRARNHVEQLRRLQWSVEETCKFASAEIVLSKWLEIASYCFERAP